jgi:hypothetical protein
MRMPVPTNKLVAFTLIGALLTTVVAGALAAPGGGIAGFADGTNGTDVGEGTGSQVTSADAPTPNENFTPEVQTSSAYEEEEHEDHEEDEEYEDEEDEDEEYEDEGDEEDEEHESED